MEILIKPYKSNQKHLKMWFNSFNFLSYTYLFDFNNLLYFLSQFNTNKTVLLNYKGLLCCLNSGENLLIPAHNNYAKFQNITYYHN